MCVCVSGSSSTDAGIVEITCEGVEQHIQQKQAVIIDVRNFEEAAEFGQIPSSNVLPGCTAKLIDYLRYLWDRQL